jgi:radical SAM superfamily enzyme YgiQ (UPF0313 family)
VLDKMKKPGIESYERFAESSQCQSKARRQGATPGALLHLGAPGLDAGLDDRPRALPEEERGIRPRQVQDFIPTPMSMATSMWFTRARPLHRAAGAYTAKDLRDKRKQKALLLYWDPAHHEEAREALLEAGRRDLIGSHPGALVPPATGKGSLSIHEQKRRGAFVERGKRPVKGRPTERAGRR